MKRMTTIRAAQPADAEALGRMHFAAWREAYGALLPASFFSAEREERRIASWATILSKPSEDTVLRIAVRDGAVVGFATAGPGRANETAGPPVRDRELWALYVLAAEYGSGLGHELLTAVLPDDVPAEVWVFEENPRARAFYAKHGFRPDGARHAFGPDWGDQSEIRLVR
jgi:GNAT superfamily N-acetyltransferase